MSVTLALLLTVPAVVGWLATLALTLWLAFNRRGEEAVGVGVLLFLVSVAVGAAFNGAYVILGGSV